MLPIPSLTRRSREYPNRTTHRPVGISSRTSSRTLLYVTIIVIFHEPDTTILQSEVYVYENTATESHTLAFHLERATRQPTIIPSEAVLDSCILAHVRVHVTQLSSAGVLHSYTYLHVVHVKEKQTQRCHVRHWHDQRSNLRDPPNLKLDSKRPTGHPICSCTCQLRAVSKNRPDCTLQS